MTAGPVSLLSLIGYRVGWVGQHDLAVQDSKCSALPCACLAYASAAYV